jgi:predicted site-specific integrase-resolvase
MTTKRRRSPPPRPVSDEKLYKLKELEYLLSAGRKTLKLWIRDGKLEAVKLGKGRNAPWRVSEAAVRQFREKYGRRSVEGE